MEWISTFDMIFGFPHILFFYVLFHASCVHCLLYCHAYLFQLVSGPPALDFDLESRDGRWNHYYAQCHAGRGQDAISKFSSQPTLIAVSSDVLMVEYE